MLLTKKRTSFHKDFAYFEEVGPYIDILLSLYDKHPEAKDFTI